MVCITVFCFVVPGYYGRMCYLLYVRLIILGKRKQPKPLFEASILRIWRLPQECIRVAETYFNLITFPQPAIQTLGICYITLVIHTQ